MPPLFSYAFAMNFKEIALQEIDFNNEEFRVSEDLESGLVLASIRAVGQLNPVLLLEREPRSIIVCGFRRLRALKSLGRQAAIARLLPGDAGNASRIFEIAIWDNISHRELNALEKARVLFKLRTVFGVSDDMLLKTYLPLLGLAPRESVLNSYLALNGVRPGLRRCLAEDRLTHSSLEALAKAPEQVQDHIASLMAAIRLSASLQKKVLELLEELSAMNGAPFDAPLDNPDVLSVLNDPRLSPFQKGENLHAALYRLRNPRLSRALERFAARKKLLGLPGSIRVSPHPFFETSNLHIELDALDAQKFRELAAALQRASEKPELEELFQPE